MVKIPEGWIETTLGELVNSGVLNIKNNLRKPIASNIRATIQGIYPYYGAASAIDYLNYYSVEGYHLLMAEDGTVTIDGKHPMLQLVDGFFNVSNHAHILQGEDKNKTKLLFYILSNIDISAFVTGAVQPKLSKDNLFKISFLYPSEEEGEKIVKLLSSFDDKIELLRAENQTLEEMGQTLFKERFGKYKVGDELPDGWKEYELSELVDTINGYSYKGNELVEKSSEALVTLKSFDRNGGFQTRGFKEFKGNPKSEQEVFVGDLVVAHTDLTQDAEVLGNPAFIVNNGGYERLYITMDLVKVNSKNENITKSFLYFLMRTKEFKGHCVGYSNGTTVLHLSKKAIPEFKIVLPKDLSGLKEKSVSFDLIMRKISHNFSQIDELTETRDQLLPKLMSGEVRVEF